MLAKSAALWSFSFVLLAAFSAATLDDSPSSERPKLPRYFTALDPTSSNMYDTKAEPVARVGQALRAMNQKGWVTVAKYYPALGRFSDETERKVSPQDPDDRRFLASFANEDPGRSPIPLISMIISLSASDVSGHLGSLRSDLLDAATSIDYDSWKLADLNNAIDLLTTNQTDLKHVKYRAPKPQLSFKQNVQVYAMTLALLRQETRWSEWAQQAKAKGHTLPPMPEMEDLANRMMHELPVIIKDGETVAFLLYRPGDIDQPVSKGEFEERADVVTVKKTGTTFALEQFPVYFTADQKQWNPSWIEPKDEGHDTTLMARKYEYDWTRFDGPYLWFRHDQLNGSLTYKATVRFQQEQIVIEAERFVSRRGAVTRVRRNPKYDPAGMLPLTPGTDPPVDSLVVDLPDLEPAQPMPAGRRKTLEQSFYRTEGREFLTYQMGPTSSVSSLYPPASAAPVPPEQTTSSRQPASVANGPVKVSTAVPEPSRR